jgi:L-asparaginase/Glu-tRNA(Gln) amidotransferase subunit D
MSKQTIHAIMTGGTIDSEWDAARDTAVTRAESIIPVYLNKLKLDIDFTYTTVCMKDSRELTHDDLKAINEAVENAARARGR